MSLIELKNINKYYNKNHILHDINLSIEEGEFMTLLGPSGCGKTTTLRLIAGLEKPESGISTIDGIEVDNALNNFHLDSSKRNLSMVFQNYALWPHMTVYENTAFGLKMKKINKKEIKGLVEKALKKLQILDLSDRYPNELSGGQQQRVALARAIVTNPKILLLDEPLSNLDAKLRIEMRNELKKLHQELNTTIICVTHDQVEAMTLSTKIAVFDAGAIAQVSTPKTLYNKPKNLKVAEFIGNSSLNMLEGTYEALASGAIIKTSFAAFNFETSKISCTDIIITIRSEDIDILKEETPNTISGTVTSVFPEGAQTQLQVKIGCETLNILTQSKEDYPVNSTIFMNFSYDNINIYDKSTGNLLN